MSKYKTDFSREELHNALQLNEGKAIEILSNGNKWAKLTLKTERFIKKARKIPVIGRFVDDLVTMIELADAYINKEYRDIPYSSIVSIVATLIYVVSPIDLIPDVIPVIGYFDDAAIIAFVLSIGIENDLKKFQNYQNEKRNVAISDFERLLSEEIADVISDGYLAASIYCENKFINLLVAESYESQKPFECRIEVIKAPTVYFNNLLLEDDEVIKVLTETLVLDNIHWVESANKIVFTEEEFEKIIDDFIFLED